MYVSWYNCNHSSKAKRIVISNLYMFNSTFLIQLFPHHLKSMLLLCHVT